jgi:hypothetical protein
MLQLVGVRRSRINRAYQRAKSHLGFRSLEYAPIIEKGKAENPLGDEARRLLEKFNHEASLDGANTKKLFQSLLDDLYSVYVKRAAQPIEKPEFTVNGVAKSLDDFIAEHDYYQPELQPSNTWMTVGRLRPETVQNPALRGLVREMWWNRTTGIHPKGTTRIARNIRVHPDGKEELVSVEVIYRGEGKSFAPFVYEPDKDGIFRLIQGPEARKKVMTCFACHFRLSGIFFGGISMPGYKPSPDWYINAIDFTRYKYHKQFQWLLKKPK